MAKKDSSSIVLLSVLLILLLISIVILFVYYFSLSGISNNVVKNPDKLNSQNDSYESVTYFFDKNPISKKIKIPETDEERYNECLINPNHDYCDLNNNYNNNGCRRDSDCRDSYDGDKFCKGNSVYKDHFKFSCQDRGCLRDKTEVKVIDCQNNCSNGECIESNHSILCRNDMDCGFNEFIGNPVCENNNVKQNLLVFKCNYPGMQNSFCTNSTSFLVKQSCTLNQSCCEGQCINNNITIACSSNSQCGNNGFIGNPICQNGNVYQNFITYTCNNPGSTQSSCTSNTNLQLKQTCSTSQTCSNGQCIAINNTVICSSNSQCGQNQFVLNPFCENDRVMQYLLTYTCNNPGAQNSFCTNSTNLEIRFDCPSFLNTCRDSQCVTCEIQCSGKQCGSNGCGGTCGNCQSGQSCDSTGKCVNQPQTKTISIVDFAFNPSNLQINSGDTIVWFNDGITNHTITSDSGTELVSATLNPGDTFNHTFNTKGSFPYHCTFHPLTMKGTVSVN